MKTTVKEVLSIIEKGSVFDSHLIIDIIIKRYHDRYLTFIAKNISKINQTAYVHSEIGKTIALYKDTLVKYLHSRSISYNAKGGISKCALWEKI